LHDALPFYSFIPSIHAAFCPCRSARGFLRPSLVSSGSVLRSNASASLASSIAACSRVTAYTSPVALLPRVHVRQDGCNRVHGLRIRPGPRLEVGGGADAVVVHLPDDAPQIAVGASTDATLRAGVGCPVDG